MTKTIFLGNLTKFFLRNGAKRRDEKKFLSKIAKKMVFVIFGAKLDFS